MALLADEMRADVSEPAADEADAETLAAEPVAVAEAVDEPVQPAEVGRLVTPTGEQICWANVMTSVCEVLAMP